MGLFSLLILPLLGGHFMLLLTPIIENSQVFVDLCEMMLYNTQ